MPRLPPGVPSLREKAIKLLQSDPYMTAWEIACEFEVSAACISGMLYRVSTDPNGAIARRKAQLEGTRGRNRRGWEYYIKEDREPSALKV